MRSCIFLSCVVLIAVVNCNGDSNRLDIAKALSPMQGNATTPAGETITNPFLICPECPRSVPRDHEYVAPFEVNVVMSGGVNTANTKLSNDPVLRDPELGLDFGRMVVDRDNAVLRNVPYGKAGLQIFDFYFTNLGEGDAPRPVVIFFHGGGFRHAKNQIIGNTTVQVNQTGHIQAMAAEFTSRGMHFVSATYRTLIRDPQDPLSIQDSIDDGKTVLQMLRYLASTYPVFRMDPNRFGLAGSSAGAVIVQNIAYRYNMNNPAGNPMEQQSTRVSAVILDQGQSLLAPDKSAPTASGDCKRGLNAGLASHLDFIYAAWTFANPTYQDKLDYLWDKESSPSWGQITAHVNNMALLYGGGLNFSFNEIADANKPAANRFFCERSGLYLFSADDPPTWAYHPFNNTPITTNNHTPKLLHHPYFGIMLEHKALSFNAGPATDFTLVYGNPNSAPYITPGGPANPYNFMRSRL